MIPKKLDLEKLKKIKNEQEIEDYLFDKVYELGLIIIDTKGIKYKKHSTKDRHQELYSISEEIYYESIWFEDFRYLVRQIENQFADEPETFEEKIEYIVKDYNELIDDLEEYNKLKDRIEKVGFEKLEAELKEKLKDIFCKMLDYKNRKYKKDATLLELLDELYLCYTDYEGLFDTTYSMLKYRTIHRDTMRDEFWTIHADRVEYISNLEFTYSFFAKDENNYKDYEQYYEDIELKEGQTLKDVCDEEKEKLRLLFIEMLEFINVDIPEKKDYSSLEVLIREYYPYYTDCFTILNGTIIYSYLKTIHYLRDFYDYFKETYKNHKEMLKDYIKRQEEKYGEAKHDEELLFDLVGLDKVNKLKERFSDYFKDESV